METGVICIVWSFFPQDRLGASRQEGGHKKIPCRAQEHLWLSARKVLSSEQWKDGNVYLFLECALILWMWYTPRVLVQFHSDRIPYFSIAVLVWCILLYFVLKIVLHNFLTLFLFIKHNPWGLRGCFTSGYVVFCVKYGSLTLVFNLCLTLTSAAAVLPAVLFLGHSSRVESIMQQSSLIQLLCSFGAISFKHWTTF